MRRQCASLSVETAEGPRPSTSASALPLPSSVHGSQRAGMVGGEIGRLGGVQEKAGKAVILNYLGSEQGEAKLGVIWIGMGPYLTTSGIHFFYGNKVCWDFHHYSVGSHDTILWLHCLAMKILLLFTLIIQGLPVVSIQKCT